VTNFRQNAELALANISLEIRCFAFGQKGDDRPALLAPARWPALAPSRKNEAAAAGSSSC
jgi:hypothetical protein